MPSLQTDRAWNMPLLHALQQKEQPDRRLSTARVLSYVEQGGSIEGMSTYPLNDVPLHIFVDTGYDGREDFKAVLLDREGLPVGELPIGKILNSEEEYLPQPRELAMLMFGGV